MLDNSDKMKYNSETAEPKDEVMPPFPVLPEKPLVEVVAISDLLPFKNHPFKLYEGERLQKLANSIGEIGLLHLIIARPHATEKGKYEILCGHNRFEAVKLLGWTGVAVIIKEDLSDNDEMALRIVVESNMNQQSFLDWKYSQQIKVIKVWDKYIKENSRQGERNDRVSETTSGQSGHKSNTDTKGTKTRDKVAKYLGISPSVFTRYRSIAKLDDEILAIICGMLDEKRLGFMAAYRISQIKTGELEVVMKILEAYPAKKMIKGAFFQSLYEESKNSNEKDLSEDTIRRILFPDEG